MRKAERLFQIIQILRRSSRPVTSARIAAELEVARRTVYRDIAHLIGQRVPIDGEAGLGYVLDPQYDMPPLMLTAEEIEAVLLGAQMVARLGDPAITTAARDVISKISSSVPAHLLSLIAEPTVSLKPDGMTEKALWDSRPFRRAIREGKKMRIEYRATDGSESHRVIWPVLLGYADTHSLLIAWCESKHAFRHFRTERVLKAEVLEDAVEVSTKTLRLQWQKWREAELARPLSKR
ncbi:YafY family protein [Rhizobium sp. SSA_523]|uniref:helix-turn-helix transcriptional regulator n=1 Tax=Rhizobium sp. SSA_523 TaxID=2952477 RepID=UPI00209019B3|nr:YafY family protein [Rhizobium sp. SSA_523]MCO5734310.1 YafY family transcriptional regulator [Rhizobium sp. SSA_523]WKC21030.1 YafY family protein [Rhizobium sp. SSA_523]